MKLLKLLLCLLFFVPAFILLGLAVSPKESMGITAGSVVGFFFALVFSDCLPKKAIEDLYGESEEE